MYKLVEYKDPTAFHDKVHSLLMEDEAANNLPLGLLNTMKTSDKYKDPLLLLVENEEGAVAGSFIMTPPHYLVCTLKVGKEEIAGIALQLKDYCEKYQVTIPGFVAEKETALQMTHGWCHVTGESFSIRMNQRVYQLNKVKDIRISRGKMVPVRSGQEELLAKWISEFVADTEVISMAGDEALKRAKDMIQNEPYVFFWEVDGKPVSMARAARRTENGITVNFVYTPSEFRKKGYASSVVAELSRLLLKDHSFCSLYTDLDNPTSNKIYMEIGYEPVCDSMMITIV
ncbi:GNAT family N-acetyltransferase [Bacillus sp. AFS015802]|uniref:GNAT family N-acetyltransferase n=1 Tax=Bacillus sp. AFS015802 TaxID=2033486 RepID=UPI000BF97DBB|nr:GNAT family N-acetyltransferase [Bacillus sp. AFS015802]PFA70752.1 GNAT family N-acetyltransferase [Bacillus sp. AFS015802]